MMKSIRGVYSLTMRASNYFLVVVGLNDSGCFLYAQKVIYYRKSSIEDLIMSINDITITTHQIDHTLIGK